MREPQKLPDFTLQARNVPTQYLWSGRDNGQWLNIHAIVKQRSICIVVSSPRILDGKNFKWHLSQPIGAWSSSGDGISRF